jgi:hypothetical protein
LQVWPQAPQLSASPVKLTQAPLQFVWPVGHPLPQTPLRQTCELVQLRAQTPQWLGSSLRLTQAPLQSVSPVAHCTWHVAPLHTSPLGQA